MPIFYTGIGSNECGIHSESEFQNIMIDNFVKRDWTKPEYQEWLNVIREDSPGRNLPQEFTLFTLDDWINFSGASRTIRIREDFSLAPEVDYSDPFN